ncbi:MAG: LysM peptidoglycan-binding domain-containing protein [Lachnospiraceae bacterium]|jgi:hypothetical protein|nr:LysM peptidoglycan-binding domain-containing protein [Lachnospiraceae bacterium]
MVYSIYKQRALRQRKINRQYRQLVLFLCGIITLLLVLLIFTRSNPAKAEDWVVETYQSVIIQPGDSLWDLAEAHRQPNMAIQDYIKEVRQINHIKTDELVSGEYLILPIYTYDSPIEN